MANIRVLDDKTINQIAAGEVVERPVSVVKELVENAMDAGATSISVEIKEGGIGLIRVTDNGCGIDKDNIRTAFLRHATSKINSIEDLFSIKSLGFRGEALSSIAAVTQIELLTKTSDKMYGLRYCIDGGREMSLEEAGIPDGTTIIVRNLFYNTPARRKFLKSSMTEANYITELMERLIMSHPSVGFRYIINGRERLVSTGNGDVKSNIYSVFGRDVANLVIPVNYEGDGFELTGFAGKPEIARGNRNFEMFFVNNRFVKCKILSRAVEEAYGKYLMLHKYPFVALYLNVPSTDIDVNVHPAKTEIKFLKEQDIYIGIIDALDKALSQRELIPEVKNEIIKESVKAISKPVPEAVISTASEMVEVSGVQRDISVSDEVQEETEPEEVVIHSYAQKPDVIFEKQIETGNAPEPFESKRLAEYKEQKESQLTQIHQATLFEDGFLSAEKITDHKIIGQVFDTYWIVEMDNKMYIIDQHAAHEKVLYERFKKRIDSDEVFSQTLYPGVIVSLSIAEEEVLQKYIGSFQEIGFEIEHFGGREYNITTVPSELFRMSVSDYFLSVLDDLMENQKISDPKAIQDRIATMACKAAIKGNMTISPAEARALIDELLTLDNPYNCPHGRPTIISYSKQEIEKLFKRIV